MALIHEKIIALLESASAVAKDQRNVEQNFNYRGIDAVVNAVSPLFKEHGVAVLPTKILEHDIQRFENKTGKLVTDTKLTIEYTWIAEDGSTFVTEVAGYGRDYADKGTAKAASVAFRTLLLQSLALPTDDKDPDAESIEVERAVPVGNAPAAPAETISAVKGEIAKLLGTTDVKVIREKGSEFFKGHANEKNWPDTLSALQEWRDSLKG
jgi:hypothetical protein